MQFNVEIIKTTRALLCAALLASPFLGIHAQGDGVGLWTDVEGETKLAKGLGLSFDAGYRMRDNFSASDRASAGVGLSYKNKTLAPWLKVGVGYSFIYKHSPAETGIKYLTDGVTPKHKNVDADYWGPRHRATASLTGSWKVARFKISLRERYQYTYRVATTCQRTRYYYNPLAAVVEGLDEWYLIDDATDEDYSYMTDTKKAKSYHKLRSRLAASYDIRKSKFEPFAEVELYNDLVSNFAMDKIRYTIGTDYKLSKTSKLSVYYRYQDEASSADDDDTGGHIIGLGYSFEF